MIDWVVTSAALVDHVAITRRSSLMSLNLMLSIMTAYRWRCMLSIEGAQQDQKQSMSGRFGTIFWSLVTGHRPIVEEQRYLRYSRWLNLFPPPHHSHASNRKVHMHAYFFSTSPISKLMPECFFPNKSRATIASHNQWWCPAAELTSGSCYSWCPAVTHQPPNQWLNRNVSLSFKCIQYFTWCVLSCPRDDCAPSLSDSLQSLCFFLLIFISVSCIRAW